VKKEEGTFIKLNTTRLPTHEFDYHQNKIKIKQYFLKSFNFLFKPT